jgi:uncharacterized protein YcbK (DUF882 family)
VSGRLLPSHGAGEALHEVGAAIHEVEETLLHAADSILETAEPLFALPEPPSSRWHRAGVTPRGERIFNVVSGVVVALFAAGWSWSIAAARADAAEVGGGPITPATARIADALTSTDAPTAAYLTDLALSAVTGAVAPMRGESGRLRARIQTAGEPIAAGGAVDSLPAGATVSYTSSGDVPTAADSAAASAAGAPLAAPQTPGVWQLAVRLGEAIRPVADFSVITMTPFSAKRRGRIGLYYIGSWPTEGRRASAARASYAPPRGFIEVTPENQDTPLSDHFRLRDFLTHDQQGVWPKYLVVDTKLVDKLELVLADLEQRGIDVSGVRVMSGFRTPQYNVGGGDPSGRAGLSRHMYGDAADIFIDSNHDGVMDDLNHDRRIDIRDARVVQDAVDRVERDHPALVGGCGVYSATGGHGPFTHIDTRGYRARWLGTGDG